MKEILERNKCDFCNLEFGGPTDAPMYSDATVDIFLELGEIYEEEYCNYRKLTDEELEFINEEPGFVYELFLYHGIQQ